MRARVSPSLKQLTPPAIGRVVIALVGLTVGLASLACAPARFPKELYTVHGNAADYPVMVSRAPASTHGRLVQAESGTHFAQSSRSYSAGDATVTVTTTQASQSEISAMDKILLQVRRNEDVLQIEHIEFYGDDFSTYGASTADRTLTIQAKAGK